MECYNDTISSNMVEVLKDYGAVPKILLRNLFPDINDVDFYIRLSYLRKTGVIVHIVKEDDVEYVCLKIKQEKDEKNIRALWIYALTNRNSECCAFGPLDYPSQLYFIKNDSENRTYQYEISVFNKNEFALLKTLDLKPGIKYIIVVPNENCVDDYMRYILANFSVKKDKFIVGCIHKKDGKRLPKINFYSPECYEV